GDLSGGPDARYAVRPGGDRRGGQPGGLWHDPGPAAQAATIAPSVSQEILMRIDRREFLQVLAMAAAGGMALDAPHALASPAPARLYDLPRFGNVHLLHFTDCHAQLLPTYFREPNVNLGLGSAARKPPHLVGEALLKQFGIAPGTREAHAFTHLDFVRAARRYGRMGGFAHLTTLVRRLKASRPTALLLDGGDTWQGSATALWTQGQDMIDAAKLLGVDLMTGHR